MQLLCYRELFCYRTLLTLVVQEIIMQQAWYSDANTGSNGEHRMSPDHQSTRKKTSLKSQRQVNYWAASSLLLTKLNELFNLRKILTVPARSLNKWHQEKRPTRKLFIRAWTSCQGGILKLLNTLKEIKIHHSDEQRCHTSIQVLNSCLYIWMYMYDVMHTCIYNDKCTCTCTSL